jgi:hypothetical protein
VGAFRPDFGQHFPAYHERLALTNTNPFFIDCAGDEAFLAEHYLAPYEPAVDLFREISVLEVGAGVPHALIRTQLDSHRRASLSEHLLSSA